MQKLSSFGRGKKNWPKKSLTSLLHAALQLELFNYLHEKQPVFHECRALFDNVVIVQKWQCLVSIETIIIFIPQESMFYLNLFS